jgi:hypothetical protein
MILPSTGPSLIWTVASIGTGGGVVGLAVGAAVGSEKKQISLHVKGQFS